MESMRPRSNVIGVAVAVAGFALALLAHAMYVASEFAEVKTTVKTLQPHLLETRGEMSQLRDAVQAQAIQSAEQNMRLKALADDIERQGDGKRRR